MRIRGSKEENKKKGMRQKYWTCVAILQKHVSRAKNIVFLL